MPIRVSMKTKIMNTIACVLLTCFVKRVSSVTIRLPLYSVSNDSNDLISMLEDGYQIDLKTVGANLTIEAEVPPDVKIVTFNLDNAALDRKEKTAPFVLGGNYGAFYYPVPEMATPGDHTITVKAQDKSLKIVATKTVRYSVIGTSDSFKNTIVPISTTVDPSKAFFSSISPSPSLVNAPSRKPGIANSIVPAPRPSKQPTVFPTGKPTTGATMIPTTIPSPNPSSSSLAPSTQNSSHHPIAQPSGAQSPKPSPPLTTPTLTVTQSLRTATPTSIPTPVSTSRPTPLQTSIPTPVPTSFPTPVPTSFPTVVPTTPAPTSIPTPVPTSIPTPVRPTSIATPVPTVVPTPVPTPEPTSIPTPVPTSIPTPLQTTVPILEPTSIPTSKPTRVPTLIPTQIPTLVQKSVPTPGSSSAPTSLPTSIQTLPQTAVPTSGSTPQPIPVPTTQPTAAPSPGPTTVPTNLPNSIQTLTPTPGPTFKPTVVPTSIPTLSPLDRITEIPTSTSGQITTTLPSQPPTPQTTYKVTAVPTPNLTKQETTSPTLAPSKTPTKVASKMPTSKPSLKPSTTPTKNPTANPTYNPTLRPTQRPSLKPTRVPVTNKPSTIPTFKPSEQPTIYPTLAPTVKPTKVPLTNKPSLIPTDKPTNRPTKYPTKKPTKIPSSAPVSYPTNVPTLPPKTLPTKANVPSGVSKPGFYTSSPTGSLNGELRKWHKVTLGFNGPFSSETAFLNPFTDYRLDVRFVHSATKVEHTVPGYYAADGNAANTQAETGNVWLVHFAPDQVGEWQWTASFTAGTNVAQNGGGTSAGYLDGATGTFTILDTNKTGRDLRGKGLLQYVGKHHLRFAETGEWFLKGGADSPENWLAYEDFDNTPNIGDRRKTWGPHLVDYNLGDPTWGNGKGKGIIGAVNYLSESGMNSFSFLTFTVGGDDKNVFPFISENSTDFNRYDVSKTGQWEILFEHATKMGMNIHIKMQEQENDQILDNGELGLQRKLYYRELIARFGHNLAMTWNIGEENTNTDAQRKQFINYIASTDPYKHPIVVHTFPNQKALVYDPLLGYPGLAGISLQSFPERLAGETKNWFQKSTAAGVQWVIDNDEQGPQEDGVVPDDVDPSHDVIRKQVLWGNLINGGGGLNYYFGYNHPNSDLTCEDYRPRQNMFTQTKNALDFFTTNNIPFWDMQNTDRILTNRTVNSCLATPDLNDIVVLLRDGGEETIDFTSVTTSTLYSIHWFDPIKGGSLQSGTKVLLSSSDVSSTTGLAPYNSISQDWIVLLRAL